MPFMPDVIPQSDPPEKMSGTKTVPDLLGCHSISRASPLPRPFSGLKLVPQAGRAGLNHSIQIDDPPAHFRVQT